MKHFAASLEGALAGFFAGFSDVGRYLSQNIVQPMTEILRTIDRHAGPAVVGVFVLTGLPILIVMLPLLLLLILIGSLALRLTGTTTGRRTLP